MLRYFKELNKDLTHIQVCMDCSYMETKLEEEEMKTTTMSRILKSPESFNHLNGDINIIISGKHIEEANSWSREKKNSLRYIIGTFNPTYIFFVTSHKESQLVAEELGYTPIKQQIQSLVYAVRK